MTELKIQNRDNKFHKDAFDKTSEERRQMVLKIALDEFALKGYSATSINDIARNAGVSIGAMYSYFSSKEDLFLAIVNEGHFLMVEILTQIGETSEDILDCLRKMIHASRQFAIEHPQLNQIYLDLSTQALAPLSKRLSNTVEPVTPVMLTEKIQNAQAQGKVSSQVNAQVASFCIDNILMMYQFSFSSDYYKERMKMYLGETVMEDVESVEKQMFDLIKNSICPTTSQQNY